MVLAAVVTDAGFRAESFAAQSRGTLASFAVPSRWTLQREPLPINPTGKVDKPTRAAQARAASAT